MYEMDPLMSSSSTGGYPLEDGDAGVQPLIIQDEADPVVMEDAQHNNNNPNTSSSPASVSLIIWRHRVLQAQQWSLLFAPLAALACLVMVGIWINQLGGLQILVHARRGDDDAKLVFNWHPLMMIIAFVFMTVASLAFRYPAAIMSASAAAAAGPRILLVVVPSSSSSSSSSRSMAKWWHGICWSVAAFCMIIGLVAVFHSHNHNYNNKDKDNNNGNTKYYIANMYSFHSWVGILVILLYFSQLVSAFIAFVVASGGGGFSSFGFFSWLGNITTTTIVSPTVRAQVMQVHYFLGPLIYKGVLLTILLGIQEKEGFIGCAYPVSQDQGPDVRPWEHFREIPAVCRISHGLGILVLLTGVLTLFALHPLDRGGNGSGGGGSGGGGDGGGGDYRRD